jgi:hypothetical protein
VIISINISLHRITFDDISKAIHPEQRESAADAIGSLGGQRFNVPYFANNSYLQLAAPFSSVQ